MMRLFQRLSNSRRLRQLHQLGGLNYLHFAYQERRLAAPACRDPLPLRSRLAAHPLLCRPHTSDILVFDQIFIEREYRPLDHLMDPGLIIDCGANVGYSSAYLLSRFPRAQLIAVEPDPGNFDLLQRNLRAFGARARAYQTAIWSHTTRLTLATQEFRDGAEWSRHVRECGPGEAGFDALDLGTILARSGQPRIALLKMDIEGAEAVVFSRNFESWLGKVDHIAIELHRDSPFGDASKAFFSAIEGQGFTITTAGELTLCFRSTGKL
jgi:FkbM family methyltransferase